MFKLNFRCIIRLNFCGPTVANLYLFILEKSWSSLNSVVLYKRFIDDILIISIFELENLRAQFLYLKLNIELGDIVNFLDLKISFDSFLQKIFLIYSLSQLILVTT